MTKENILTNRRKLNIFIFLIGLLCLLLTASSYLFRTVSTDLLFNSDSMYLPMLFDDIFKDGGNFLSWYLTPAPGFFPDMALFFVIRALISDTYYNFLGYSAAQITLSYVLGLIVIRSFNSDSPRRYQEYIVFSSVFLFAVATFVTRGYTPYNFSLLPIYRFGAIFNTLILTLFIFFSFNSQTIISRVGIFLISFLGAATDLMFLPMAIFPASLAIIITSITCSKNFSWKRGVTPIFLMFSGMLSGILIKELIFSNDTTLRYVGINNTPFWVQIKIAGKLIGESLSLNPLIGLIIFVFYSLVTFQLITLFKSESRDFKRLYLLIFLILSPLFSFLIVITNGVLSETLGDTRYICNLYWNPIFFSWIVTYSLAFNPLAFNSKLLKFGGISLAATMFLSIFPLRNLQLGQRSPQVNHYPELVQCVDETVERYQGETGESISRGIALYWEAKLISHFSKKDLTVLQVLSNLSPFLWINNPDWYAQPNYDFAVLPLNQEEFSTLYQAETSLSNRDLVVSINGEPKSQEVCSISTHPLSEKDPGERLDFAVMIYGPRQLKSNRFALGSKGIKILACTLPTQVGVPREEDCSMVTSNSSEQGYLTFGPYLEVPAGTYRAQIEYESDANAGTIVGEWDIALQFVGELKILKNGVLEVNEETSKLEILFEVPKELDRGIIELRTIGQATYSLSVQSIFLERLE